MPLTDEERDRLNTLIRNHNKLLRYVEGMDRRLFAAMEETWYMRLYFWLRPPAWPSFKPKPIPLIYGDPIVPEVYLPDSYDVEDDVTEQLLTTLPRIVKDPPV